MYFNEHHIKKMDNEIDIEMDSGPNCSICLESLDKTCINYTELTCKHSFHAECIVTWLSMGNKICPLCKQTVYRDEELDPLPPPMIELNEINNNQNNNNDNYSVLEHIMLSILSLVIIFYLANLQRIQDHDNLNHIPRQPNETMYYSI